MQISLAGIMFTEGTTVGGTMKTVFSLRAILLGGMLMIALVALSGILKAQTEDPAPTASATCCYTNSAFVGVCKITADADDTCDTILAYLNTPGTVGKSYCGGSKIRGGWKQVDCPSSNGGGAKPSVKHSKDKQETRVCAFKKGS